MRTKLTCAATALLFVAALPVFAQQSAQAAEVAGPATCYIADENETILEPRQEYQPAPGSATLPSIPSPVVQGSYTLQTSAPAVTFDPDNPAIHFVCEVNYSPLGRVRLVGPSGQVLASTVYANDQADPSRAASTTLPQLPAGYEIVPGQSVFGYNQTAQTVDPNNPADARGWSRYRHHDPPDFGNTDSRAVHVSASGSDSARNSNDRGPESFGDHSHHACSCPADNSVAQQA